MNDGKLKRLLRKAERAGTFSEWGHALRGVEASFEFDIVSERSKLKEMGLPTFDYWNFDGKEFERERVKRFFKKYGFVIAIVYLKN